MDRHLFQRAKVVVLLIPVCLCVSVSLIQFIAEQQRWPQIQQEYPWLSQPIRPETKTYFCRKLNLTQEHPVCRANNEVLAVELLYVLQDRFPTNKTAYSEIASTLKEYPLEIDETTTPSGIVTAKTYIYLLTEFDGFCVYFSTTDLQSEVIERIYSSSLGSGSSPTVCGSDKLRAQPRPFLTPTP